MSFYGTQGGGTAERINDRFYFVEVPNWGNFRVGQEVPEEWDIQGPFESTTGKQVQEDEDESA